jgi:hypothetical protein
MLINISRSSCWVGGILFIRHPLHSFTSSIPVSKLDEVGSTCRCIYLFARCSVRHPERTPDLETASNPRYSFGSSLTNNQFTVVNELFPNHLRSQASAISISALYLIQVLWLNVGPLALERVSWRFYIVFIVLAACGAIFVYFFVPNVS